jgi:RNA polymerase sigma-70 factor (ECF subfamily)
MKVKPNQKNSVSEKSDEELVFLVLKDPNIYEVFIERYEKKLLRYIRRIAFLSEEDAQDVLQNVFIKTYQNLNGFNTSLKFSSWIYRITHNETISHLRKTRARPQIADFEDEDLLDRLASEENLESEFSKKEDTERLKLALDKIDKKYRDILVLRFMEEKDYQEISDILEKPLGTVSVTLKRAKEQLKKIIEKEKI